MYDSKQRALECYQNLLTDFLMHRDLAYDWFSIHKDNVGSVADALPQHRQWLTKVTATLKFGFVRWKSTESELSNGWSTYKLWIVKYKEIHNILRTDFFQWA